MFPERGGAPMTSHVPGTAAVRSLPGPADILEQLEAALVVTGVDGNLLYANPYAVRLFGFPDDAAHLVGRSLASLGFEEGDAPRVSNLVTHVVRGRPWEGTFACRRVDGSRLLVRARAASLHDSSGEIIGIAIIGRAATMRGSRSERDRLRVLERIGERLAHSLEVDVTLRQVAETLVPQFADHCVIDLFQGDKLVRKAQLHARGWTPEPGSWAMIGEPIRYPEGHFCERAMSRRDTVVADIADEQVPEMRQASLDACENVGLRSVDRDPADRARRV